VSYRERQRLADIQAAIDAIRSHLQRGDLSDGLVFDAVRIRLLEIGEAVKALPEEGSRNHHETSAQIGGYRTGRVLTVGDRRSSRRRRRAVVRRMTQSASAGQPVAGRRPAPDMADGAAPRGLGYDWHNLMHMIASLVTEDVYWALTEHHQSEPAAYARRLKELPGDWPPPETAR
jgi:hypothetical protein